MQKKEARYAVALLPTPVLNTPDFQSVFGGKDGKTLKLSKKNLIEDVEFIALPKTAFTIEEIIKKNNYETLKLHSNTKDNENNPPSPPFSKGGYSPLWQRGVRGDFRVNDGLEVFRGEILKVKTEEYPYATEKGYYIDSRFVEKRTEKPSERIRSLPDKNTVISRLLSAKGARYVWGGNYVNGIPEMLEFYKPSSDLSEDIKDRWMLKGVDCSGLLYEATDGYIPRNTESLFHFGSPVDIESINPDEIVKKLRPLDIIVYARHVAIVLNDKELIESTASEGVKIKSLNDYIKKISRKMLPVNDYNSGNNEGKFVVRRWH